MLGPDVVCGNGHRYATSGGYLDLSGSAEVDDTTARTLESFGFEWNTFDDVREEDAEFATVYFRDLDFESLRGQIGVDVGCGKGRYTRFLAPHLDGLVALDGSRAVEAAARNLAVFPNVLVVKADLQRAPVAAGSVDVVTCLGVLHHLRDPRRGHHRRPARAHHRRRARALARQRREPRREAGRNAGRQRARAVDAEPPVLRVCHAGLGGRQTTVQAQAPL